MAHIKPVLLWIIRKYQPITFAELVEKAASTPEPVPDSIRWFAREYGDVN